MFEVVIVFVVLLALSAEVTTDPTGPVIVCVCALAPATNV